jgi:hypothetical protein
VPERERLAGVADAARVDPALSAKAIGAKLVQQLGISGPGLLGSSSFGDIYIDHSLPSADQKRLIVAAVAAYRAYPQVEAVFTANQVAATPLPTTPPDKWSEIERLRASYYPGRSGAFLVVLKKDITPIADTRGVVATHGSLWDYDRRVPIVFWRPGLAGNTIQQAVDTVDIMPTLAAQIGFDVAPGSVDGRCLPEAASCPAPGALAPPRGSR